MSTTEAKAYTIFNQGSSFDGKEFPIFQDGTEVTIDPRADTERFSGSGAQTLMRFHAFNHTVVATMVMFDVSWLINNGFSTGSTGKLILRTQEVAPGGDPLDTSFINIVMSNCFLESQPISLPVSGGRSAVNLTFNAYDPLGRLEKLIEYTVSS